jgi:hypothetical protein
VLNLLWGAQRGLFLFFLVTHVGIMRTSLDSNEEVHRSRVLREWSNMIGYEMGSSRATVYTMAKTFPLENFKHG